MLGFTMVLLMWFTGLLLSHTDSAQMNVVNQPNSVITAASGDNVTLHCFRTEGNNDPIIWYKQTAGHEPRVIVTVHKLALKPVFGDEFQKSSRFSVVDIKESCHLKITNVEPSDEATYYCGLKTITITFGKGTFLSVRGKPGLSVSVSQIGVLDSVPAGASVTLQCSVLSESRAAELQVLWFRAATPQSHPQIIYTHHNSSRQCESGSSTHTCVYNFSKNILSLNDTGTYYCAVAACGKIIFGNGTRVQLRTPFFRDTVRILLSVALGVCVIVIFAHVLSCKGRSCEYCRVKSVGEKTHTQSCYAAGVNFSASCFKERKIKPWDSVYSEVVYSSFA